MPKDSDSIIITTGPIPGSQKVYVEHGDLRIPFREVALEESANEPPVRLYDTSGPYTDATFAPQVDQGLPRMREEWIRERGDVEEYAGREARPEDNHRRISGNASSSVIDLAPLRPHYGSSFQGGSREGAESSLGRVNPVTR